MSEYLPRMVEFVEARLDELERDAPLLGAASGVITETWVLNHVEASRMVLRMYEDNTRVSSEAEHRSHKVALKWAVFALADSFKHHPDYDPALWSGR